MQSWIVDSDKYPHTNDAHKQNVLITFAHHNIQAIKRSKPFNHTTMYFFFFFFCRFLVLFVFFQKHACTKKNVALNVSLLSHSIPIKELGKNKTTLLLLTTVIMTPPLLV